MTEPLSIKGPIQAWRVNAFTDMPFTGNPAGVVPDADGLSDQLMLNISGELNDISETVFICRPETKNADLRLRYFTSTTEVDLCGHATVSALFVLAWLGRIEGKNETKIIRAETKAGILELGLTFVEGEPGWAIMEQLAPQVYPAPGADFAAEILGLPTSAISDELEIGCASSGLWACFVPLKNLTYLQRVKINSPRIQELWPENHELTGVYPFVFLNEHVTQGRFFSPPKYGIFEDPVTGTASGALGAYLLAHNRMPKEGELLARQGFEMGRGGMVKVSRNTNGKMTIKGQAVVVFRGEINLAGC
ncbi:MAG: PhzF family phenazine biosynthesis protein [Verrucomicrobiae bacterium]|nr:PhzF family phenazine biosynthesis protein [Verrucomicrobiae bacterium]